MTSAFPTAAATRMYLRVQTVARPGRRPAMAALVTALVVGILGMHALASHGNPAAAAPASSMTGMTSAHEAAMASGGSHDGHAHPAAAEQSGTATAAAVTADADFGSSHDMASMVMLCVVMLAAAALTLLVLLVAGFLRSLLPVAFKPAPVRDQALQWVRGTGPPHEWQFSVIRC